MNALSAHFTRPTGAPLAESGSVEQSARKAPSAAAEPHDAPLHAYAAQAARARKILRLRRRRNSMFDTLAGKSMFGEPCWDMMLDLYIAWVARQGVSVSSLCIASNVPATTALRSINAMIARGLISRRADPLDRRRTNIYLSDDAAAQLTDLLTD